MSRRYEPMPRRTGGRRPSKKYKDSFLHTLFCWWIPFFLINGVIFILVAARPHLTLKVGDTTDFKSTTASITVYSLLPLQEFTATQEELPLEPVQTDKHHYTLPVLKNGVISVHAKCINGMTATVYEHVDILDDMGPIPGDVWSIKNGILTLTLEDSQSGLDFDSVYASSTAGVNVMPSTIEKKTGTFTFKIGKETLNIHACDLAGNAMQAAFSADMDTQSP